MQRPKQRFAADRPAALGFIGALDQLLEVDHRCGEQGLNLHARAAPELGPLEAVLGLQFGHHPLAHDLPPAKPSLAHSGRDALARPIHRVGSPTALNLAVASARRAALWLQDALRAASERRAITGPATREVLRDSPHLQPGRADVQVTFGIEAERLFGEAASGVAAAPIVQRGHDLPCNTLPDGGLTAVAA